MKAVVADALNSYEVVDLDLAPPRAGEVLVCMAATDVCHSDFLSVSAHRRGYARQSGADWWDILPEL